MLNKPVLVLDNGFMPINIISARKSINLVLLDKAEIIESHKTTVLRSQYIKLELPDIIRLKNFFGSKKYNSVRLRLSKKTLLYRDRFTCQYCKKQLNLNNCTVDHIIPKGIGGRTTWNNCVISCMECNRKKGNKTLEEVGMKLSFIPKKLDYISFMNRMLKEASNKLNWKTYIIN